MKINNADCLFMPMELFLENDFLPLVKIIKGSTIGWNVKRKFISYNQLKKVIKNPGSLEAAGK